MLLEGKLLARSLAAPPVPWDDDIPAQEKIKWAEWMQQVLEDSRLSIQQSVTPPGTVERPVLAGYADARLVACAVAVYVVSKLAPSSQTQSTKRPGL